MTAYEATLDCLRENPVFEQLDDCVLATVLAEATRRYSLISSQPV